jgi:hypothetical protein
MERVRQSYVNNIHAACPAEYAYAYDDTVGLHTRPTGASYTITFCPGGSGGGGGGGGGGDGISTTAWYTLANQGNGSVDDNAWGTTNGRPSSSGRAATSSSTRSSSSSPPTAYYRVMVRQASSSAWT